MKKLLVVLALLAAHPLAASCRVDLLNIAPARPTTTDSILVVMSGGCSDGCIPQNTTIDVDAGTVTIAFEYRGACILVPQPWGERVDVGRLPAGTYTLIVTFNGTEMTRRTLTVRELPFTLRPSFGGAGTQVVLGIGSATPTAVTFGGVPAQVSAPIGGDVVVTVPQHAPGLVDVVVTTDSGKTLTAGQAYLYPEPQADLSNEHERVFYPSVFAGPGAHGSLWASENVVLNRGPIAIATIPLLGGLNAAPVLPIPGPLVVGERAQLPELGRDGGLFVLVPRGVEQWLAYASHIADRSRRATDAGTEMPVVHEVETSPEVVLLDVPLTDESRQTLRIFDFDAVDGRTVTVYVRIPGKNPVTLTQTLTNRIVCVTTPCYPQHPTFAVVNLDAVPQLRGLGKVDIEIFARTRDMPLWAYVSVTNNDTQHVTTYTPQQRRASQR